MSFALLNSISSPIIAIISLFSSLSIASLYELKEYTYEFLNSRLISFSFLSPLIMPIFLFSINCKEVILNFCLVKIAIPKLIYGSVLEK